MTGPYILARKSTAEEDTPLCDMARTFAGQNHPRLAAVLARIRDNIQVVQRRAKSLLYRKPIRSYARLVKVVSERFVRSTEEGEVPCEVPTSVPEDGLEWIQRNPHEDTISYKLVTMSSNSEAESFSVRTPVLTLLSISLSCYCSIYPGRPIDTHESHIKDGTKLTPVLALGHFIDVSGSAFLHQGFREVTQPRALWVMALCLWPTFSVL